MSVDDAFQVSVHLAGSEEWLGLAAVLFQVMNATEDSQQFDRVSWVLLFFKPGVQWAEEIPSQLRIVIRAMQIRGLLLTEKPSVDYESDLEELIENAGIEDSLAVFFAHYQTSFLLKQVSPEVMARKAIQGARAFHKANVDLPQDITVRPEEAFWGAVPNIKALSQIPGIIETVRIMTVEERHIVFAPHVGTDMANMLVEMCYSIEADQPEDTQDWNKVLLLLRQIKSVGDLEGAEVLSWAALRAEALVLADFQGNTQDALSLLDLDDSVVDEKYRFLLTYTQACILLSHDESKRAFEKFYEALSISVEADFPFLLSDALCRGMLAAAMESRFDISIRWGSTALQRGTSEVGVGRYEKIELIGELAWAHWCAGNKEKACGAMYGAVMNLISGGRDNIARHNEVLVKVGHVLGWLAGEALSGTPPKTKKDGQEYIDPYPGLISLKAKQVPEFDANTGLHYLPSQLAMMARGVGIPRMAVAAYKVSADLAREMGYLVFSAASDLERAPLEADLENFDQAIGASLSGLRAIPFIRENQSTALSSFVDPDEHWKTVEVSEKRSIGSFYVFYEVLLPAFTSMVAKGTHSDIALRTLSDLSSAISNVGSRLLLTARWQRILRHMATTFDSEYNRIDIVNEINALEDGEDYERFTLYIALATHHQRTPYDMSRLHAILLTHVTTPQPANRTVVDSVIRWIISSWKIEVETRAFRLNSPGLLRATLEPIPSDSTKTTDAARIVITSEAVSGTQFSTELRDLLRQLAER
jgi:hypothetical protein